MVRMMTKKQIIYIVLLVVVVIAVSCIMGMKKNNEKLVHTFDIGLQQEFRQVNIKISIEDFNKLGYQYGDSLDIKFSNSEELKDIPYYSGYNTRVNMPLIVAYPGYPYISFAYTSGKCSWDAHHLSESDTVTVKLNKKAKYLAIEKALSLKYSCNYDDYKDEKIFANFRQLCCDELKPDTFYRGASPCDNQYNRAKYVNDLLEKNNIKYIIDLADNFERINSYFTKSDFQCNYLKSLYDKNSVCLSRLHANYQSKEYATIVVESFRKMMKNEGSYYIHCTEGKDRTGFVCALIEVLAGATFEEVADDYMITYTNYYNINKETELEKYNAILEIKFIDIYKEIIDAKEDRDFSGYIGSEDAKHYLRFGGMSEEEIEKFVSFIKK